MWVLVRFSSVYNNLSDRDYLYWCDGRRRPRVGKAVVVPVRDGEETAVGFITAWSRDREALTDWDGSVDEVIGVVRPTDFSRAYAQHARRFSVSLTEFTHTMQRAEAAMRRLGARIASGRDDYPPPH